MVMYAAAAALPPVHVLFFFFPFPPLTSPYSFGRGGERGGGTGGRDRGEGHGHGMARWAAEEDEQGTRG